MDIQSHLWVKRMLATPPVFTTNASAMEVRVTVNVQLTSWILRYHGGRIAAQ